MVVSPPSYPIYQWVKQAQLLTSEVSWGDLQSRDYSSTKMGTISQNQDRQKRSLRRAWASPYGWWCGQEAQKNSMRHQKWILTSKKRTRSPTLCFFFKFHGLQNQKPGEYRVHVQALHLGIGSFRCRTGDVWGDYPVASVGFSGEVQLIWTS